MFKMLMDEDLIKLLAAVLVGGLIGLEREYRSKSAGFRTFTIVCLGSTIFTILSQHISPNTPDRIAANIVTGIGFLGAGVIFKTDDRVSGLTTATIIWVTAALGMAIGTGHILLSIGGAFFVLLVLILFNRIEKVINHFNQVRHYRLMYEYDAKAFERYQEIFETCNLHIQATKQQVANHHIVSDWTVRGRAKRHDKLVRKLLADRSLKELDF